MDEYVTDASGTGVVHQAPAFGEDDMRVCLAQGMSEHSKAQTQTKRHAGCTGWVVLGWSLG